MTTEEQFNLVRLIREVVSVTVADDPEVVADEVLDKIGDDDLRVALRQVLRGLVVDAYAEQRRQVLRKAQEEAAPPARPQNDSPRWRATSAVYLGFMQNRLHVDGQFKKVGDCTAADLAAAAQERFDIGQATINEGNRIALLRQEIIKAGVQRVGDLDEAVVLEVIRWQP